MVEKEFLKSLDKLMDSMNALVNLLSEYSVLERGSIPNMAITYNNKIVELQRLYEKAGLSFWDGVLSLPIANYFIDLIATGVATLESLVPHIKRVPIFPHFQKKQKEHILAILESYRQLDEMIFVFSLDRDIVKVIKADKKMRQEGDTQYGEDLLRTMIYYQKELAALGFSTVSLEDVFEELLREFKGSIEEGSKNVNF